MKMFKNLMYAGTASLLLFFALPAMAQTEINPDHYDMVTQPAQDNLSATRSIHATQSPVVKAQKAPQGTSTSNSRQQPSATQNLGQGQPASASGRQASAGTPVAKPRHRRTQAGNTSQSVLAQDRSVSHP
jgi:hypothetical protein